jgi:hypothetical protein
VINAAANHKEQYVYHNDNKISDDKESILKVFTSKMYLMEIIDVYQYAPVIDIIKYLDGIELLEELDEMKIPT